MYHRSSPLKAEWWQPHLVPRALEAPLRTIAENIDQESSVVVNRVREGGLGYNAATSKYEDLLAAGVVDPAKVTRSAGRNAASLAGLLSPPRR